MCAILEKRSALGRLNHDLLEVFEMSRLSLSRVFVLPPDLALEDLNGRTLDQWDRYGVLGWDDGCASYFLTLQPRGHDMPVWSFGDRAAEFGSPWVLQQVLRVLFNVDQAGVEKGWFAFKPGMAERLANDRDTYFDRHPVAENAREAADDLLRSFHEEDASYQPYAAPLPLDEAWLLAHALVEPVPRQAVPA
ncbi:hypothetical protein [Cupriavidus malaysiensis]|nr:hypothetical protein [Cupriavidus malaysiensis]AOZ05921.1 hypothetical protein BKK80_08860 [Cupriavidus malaysiensis]